MTRSEIVSVGGGTPTVDFSYGKGIWLWDRGGRRFLDCTSQSWALYLGHANDEIAQHATEVMQRSWHVHQGFATDAREHFAAALLDLVPDNGRRDRYSRVAFTATSGLAVETAVKLAALNRPGRYLIGRVEGGFHGTTLGTAQLSWPATEDVGPDQRTLARFRPFGADSFTLSFPITDDVTRELDLLRRELDSVADKLVAVVVEPIQGSGGQRVVPDWWLTALVERADEAGFVVIFDEIQTYLRAGRHYTHPEALRPHFIVLGKGVCAGFAAGAVVMRDDMNGFPSAGTYDLHTFASSALAHSMGLKLLEVVARDDVLANARARGAQVRSVASRWCQQGAIFHHIHLHL